MLNKNFHKFLLKIIKFEIILKNIILSNFNQEFLTFYFSQKFPEKIFRIFDLDFIIIEKLMKDPLK